MALPPLPPTTTARYKLHYAVGTLQHVLDVHVPTATTSDQAVTYGTALANLLKGICGNNVIFQAIDWAALGSNVFNQIATLNIVGAIGGAITGEALARECSFAGRSLSGRKTRLFLFGVAIPNDANWRIERGEHAGVAAVIDGLNAGVGQVACIDATLPVWRPYMNYWANKHWVKRARQGGG